MARRRLSVLRVVLGNVWALVCLIAAGTCGALAVQLVLQVPAPDMTLSARARMLLAVPALFGALAGLYGAFASVALALRSVVVRRLRSRLRAAQKQAEQMEALQARQRARLEELSTLREVATVVNQESDFTIIAEKVLELIAGLLEPAVCALFLAEGDDDRLTPFAEHAQGKALTGRKVKTRQIAAYDPTAFERHSIVCRTRGKVLEALVPLRVEDKILGVLLLAFRLDGRRARQQAAEFNESRRPLLLEVSHHISLAVKAKHLQTRAVVDGLTGLYSRSHFDLQLQAAVELAQRTREVLSLIVVDIDHFKRVNDSYGHQTGDVVLARVASRIQKALRKYDTAYRYGGEEIVILLPRTNLRQAVIIAERLRGLVESQRVRGAEGQLVSVTVSLGVAQFQPNDSPRSLFERADQRLYRAKREGRNRVVPAAA